MSEERGCCGQGKTCRRRSANKARQNKTRRNSGGQGKKERGKQTRKPSLVRGSRQRDLSRWGKGVRRGDRDREKAWRERQPEWSRGEKVAPYLGMNNVLEYRDNSASRGIWCLYSGREKGEQVKAGGWGRVWKRKAAARMANCREERRPGLPGDRQESVGGYSGEWVVVGNPTSILESRCVAEPPPQCDQSSSSRLRQRRPPLASPHHRRPALIGNTRAINKSCPEQLFCARNISKPLLALPPSPPSLTQGEGLRIIPQ